MDPQILAGDIIYYPDWRCDGTEKVIHYTKKAGKHTLRFEFGDQITYAYNGNDFSSDSNCNALWNLESDLTIDSKGSNDLINQGFAADSVDYKEGSGSGASVKSEGDRMLILDASLDSGFPLKSGESNKTFSLAFWVKFTGTISDTQYIIGKSNSFLAFLSGSKVRLYTSSNGSSWTDLLSHETALVTGRWYHIGVTYDNGDYLSRIRIWDDTAQAIVGSDATGTLDDINIGTSNFVLSINSTIAAIDGKLDEMVVFNDVLTVDEIDQIQAGTYGAVGNNSPTITSVTDSPDPLETGSNITFSVDWNDADAEGIKMYICKANDGGTSGCGAGGAWCENSNDYDLTDPITCAYTTQAGDVGSNNYYAFVCDDEPSCSPITSGTFTVQSPSPPPPNGNDFSGDANCIADWRFESGELTADSKGNNTLENGGASSDTTEYKEGACSAHLARAEDDYMDIADENLDSGFPCKSGEENKSFSVAFWVKFDSLPDLYHHCFTKYSSSDSSFRCAVNNTGGKAYMSLSISSDGGYPNNYQHASAIAEDTWYHVAMTYDNSDYSYRIRIWDDTAGAILGVDKIGTATDIHVGAVKVGIS